MRVIDVKRPTTATVEKITATILNRSTVVPIYPLPNMDSKNIQCRRPFPSFMRFQADPFLSCLFSDSAWFVLKHKHTEEARRKGKGGRRRGNI